MTHHSTHRGLILVLGALLALTAAVQADENAAELYRQAAERLLPEGNAFDAALGDWSGRPVDADARQLLDDNAEAIGLLRKAAAAPRCDWGTDFSAGIATPLPYLQHGRRFAALMTLSAQRAADDGAFDRAGTDLLSTLSMARHFEADRLTICRLVGISMRAGALDAAAGMATQFPAEALRALAMQLDQQQVGPPAGAAQTVRAERDVVIGWLNRLAEQPDTGVGEFEAAMTALAAREEAAAARREWADPAARRRLLDALSGAYGRVAEAIDTPDEAAWAAAETEAAATAEASAVGRATIPAFGRIRSAVRNDAIRWQMFRAGLAMLTEGRDARQRLELADPASGQAFDLLERPGGFELLSTATDLQGEPIRLRFGRP